LSQALLSWTVILDQAGEICHGSFNCIHSIADVCGSCFSTVVTHTQLCTHLATVTHAQPYLIGC